MTGALMELKAVSKSFGGLRVLRNVDLSIERGHITGLIGPNGAGKSTLFNVVSGFLGADGGSIVFGGRSMRGIGVAERSRLGLVRTFQTPQVFGHMSVRENLVAGCHKRGRSGFIADMLGLGAARRELRNMEDLAVQTAIRFGLGGVQDVAARLLPAGQRRLLELARAAIAEPLLLCLDEPSSGLNAEETNQLGHILTRLNREGMSIFLVSHDMDLMNLASVVSVLCFGEIIAHGDFATVKSSPRVLEAYLGA